jgi:hypothetical protein
MGGSPPALLRLILELEVVDEEMVEAERRRIRPVGGMDASVEERVDELGVDSLINEGT